VSTPLDTDVGQMRLLVGHRSATSAAGRFEPSRRGRRGQQSGVLYVLAAVEDDPGEAIARTLVNAVGEAFQSAQGSLTSRLIRAVRAGSAALLQENLDLVSRSPRTGGVACALLRQDDVYLAQAGTTVACICQRGTLTHLLSDDPDADTKQDFGRRQDPEVQLAHHAVKPGNSVALASAGLLQEIDDRTLIEALSFADANISLDHLAAALPGGEGAALVLAIRGRITPALTPKIPTPRTIDERVPIRPRPTLPPEEPPEEAAAPRRPPAPPGPTLMERLRGQLASIQKSVRQALANTGRVTGDWLRRFMPGGEGPYRGERRPPSRKLRRQTATADNPVWQWVALGLPVIVVLLVAAIYWKRGWDRQAQYDELMAKVDEQLEIAATADEATARLALETALQALDEAPPRLSTSEELLQLQTSVQEQLDTLNKVIRLSEVERLHTYPAAGSADQIVVHGADIYVLDRLTDRVYHHRLNGTGTALESDEEKLLVRRGDQPDDTATVGKLVGMAWMPGGQGRQTGALFILGGNGQLLIHDPTWERLIGTTLPASETWRFPLAVSGYRGNFYVLDPGLGQVLRYRTSGEGYASPPEPYFADETPDMTHTIDIAIDGFVYLLFEDGRLEKYLRGEPVPLTLSPTDKPLQRASAIFAAPDEEAQYLYLADPVHGRVLRCDKEGHVIQQFIAADSDTLEEVRDIFVDEVGGRLYFLSRNQLFMTHIPPP
jgi:hypothetical protein